MMMVGYRAASVEYTVHSDHGNVTASCEACIGRGEMLLPRVAMLVEPVGPDGNLTALDATELGALALDDAVARGVKVIVRGELPVASILMGGAKAFVQVGVSPRSRSWAVITAPDGSDLSSESAAEALIHSIQ